MKRRSFLKGAIGALFAPKILKAEMPKKPKLVYDSLSPTESIASCFGTTSEVTSDSKCAYYLLDPENFYK